ncbi:MAG: hypothetical protein HZA46_19195 [Planctomycetales bacterium]|nr:hypothetical protein [Planctomycetales bacterium]
MNLNFGHSAGGMAQAIGCVTILLAIANLIVHIAFAVGVMSDTAEIERRGGRIVLVAAIWWTIATLIGGVFVAGAYWVIHHSNLGRVEPRQDRPPDVAPAKSRAEEKDEAVEKLAAAVLTGDQPKPV